MDEYKTTWREKLGYGIGAVGLDLSYGMFYSYLSYYLSSVLGLKEGSRQPALGRRSFWRTYRQYNTMLAESMSASFEA